MNMNDYMECKLTECFTQYYIIIIISLFLYQLLYIDIIIPIIMIIIHQYCIALASIRWKQKKEYHAVILFQTLMIIDSKCFLVGLHDNVSHGN